MKGFEVGDEVLVKLVVRGWDDKDLMLGLPYHGFDDGPLDDQHWVSKWVVVENQGKPQPAEPQKRGAIVRASGLGQNTPVRFVRTDYNPDYPWSPLGPQRGPGPFTWGHITGPEGNRNRTVVVEFEGLY